MTGAKTVLIVEEDDALREELAQQLRADGHRVVTLEDGFELCDYLELAVEGKAPAPKLIVADVDLAGVSGRQICRVLSRGENALPFILLARCEAEGAGAGAVRVLNKSLALAELHAEISGVLCGLAAEQTTAA